jgi:hypothetical protein
MNSLIKAKNIRNITIITCFFIIFLYINHIQYKSRVNFNKYELIKLLEDARKNSNFSAEKFKAKDKKVILFYMKFFNQVSWYMDKEEAGESELNSVKCPVTNCIFTHNHDTLNNYTQFDAIIFHGPERFNIPRPQFRLPQQLYIFASLE